MQAVARGRQQQHELYNSRLVWVVNATMHEVPTKSLDG